MTEVVTGSVYSGAYGNIVRIGHQYYGDPNYPGGNGSITITGDNQQEIRNVGNLSIGGTFGISGDATLDGSTYGVQINVQENLAYSNGGGYGRVAVGENGGNGTLLITNGAQVVSTNNATYDAQQQFIINGYNSLAVGRGDNSVGVMTVTGNGSFFGAYGLAPRLQIGRDGGTGTLNISNDGTVGSLSVEIGRRDDANGTVNVDGGRLVVNDSYGQFGNYLGNDYSGFAGTMRVGRQNGDGTLNVTNGGVVDIYNTDGVTDSPRLDIARGVGSTGTVLVSGVGSEINVTQNGLTELSSPGIRVGAGGYGKLTVENSGTVNITGDSAFLGVSDRFGYGDYTGRSSVVEIRNGGVINVTGGAEAGGNVQVGQVNGQRGRMTIDGAGSQLNLTSDNALTGDGGAFLSIGNRSDGYLSVTNGGEINIDGNNALFPGINIGRGEDDGSVRARGELVINGAGSSVNILGDNVSEGSSSGFIAVGSRPNAEGVLRIENGGSLTMSGANSTLVVGNRDGAEGDVRIDGAGSSLSVGGEIQVGPNGDGFLDLTNGATLTATTLRVGESGEADLVGTVNADIVLDSGLFSINDDDVGALTVNGDFNAGQGSALFIDINDLDVDDGDTLSITGDGNFLTRQMIFVVQIDETVDVNAGDEFVFATVGGTLSADTRVVFDINRGIELTLSADGSNLILTANEDALTGDPFTGDGDANLITGDGDANTLTGLGGDDTLVGLGGDDQLLGGDDDDVLNGGLGADTLDGGGGVNTVSFEDAVSGVRADLENAIPGSSEATGDVFTNIQNIIGSGQSDRFFATNDANLINTGDGNDSVIARDGDDTVIGGQGADTLFGLDGNDLLTGGAGIDSLLGGNDNDTLEGGAEADVLNGGRGIDTATFINSSASVVADLRRSDGSTGDAAGDDFQFIENLQGTDFSDRLTGNNIVNVLLGEDGADRLVGLRGDDTLDGGRSVDQLTGGDGNDLLIGGRQRDIFIFNDDDESGVGAGNRDIIADFSQSLGEEIRLNRIDGDSTTSGDQDLFFVNGDAFSNTAGEVRFEQVGGNTIVQLDTNGDAVADMEIELTGLFTLVSGDFSF
ncbi:MAG: hypothetical protein ACPG4X_13325 [Pikeienuella sp.]